MRSELLRRGERVAARYEAITVCCESALWVGFSCLHLQNPPQKGSVYDTRKPSVLLKVVRPELVHEPGTCDRGRAVYASSKHRATSRSASARATHATGAARSERQHGRVRVRLWVPKSAREDWRRVVGMMRG